MSTPQTSDLLADRQRRAAGTSVAVEGEELVVSTPYNAGIVSRLREQVGGSRWDAATKTWRAPLALVPARQLMELLASEFGPSAEQRFSTAAVMRALHEVRVRAAQLKGLSSVTELPRQAALFGAPTRDGAQALAHLREYQSVAVEYAALCGRRVLITDDVGAGKTVVTLALLELFDAFPALVVIKATAIDHWERHVRAWLPHRTVATLPKGGHLWPSADATGADVTLATWGQLSTARAGPGQVKRWRGRGVAFDEFHKASGRGSKRTEAALALSRDVPVRVGLTATPVVNRPVELIKQLQVLGRLNDLGGFWWFAKRFCDAQMGEYGWDLTGSSNLDELNDLLRSTCMVGRTKEQFWPQMPEETREAVVVDLPSHAAERYEAAERDVMRWIRDTFGESPRAADRPRHVDADPWTSGALEAAIVRINRLRHETGRAKAPLVAEWVSDFLEDCPDKIVVFAWHHDVVDRIARGIEREMWSGSEVVVLTGETPVKDRAAIVERFQSDAGVRVLVANVEAGGESIELTASWNVVFAELAWTAAAHRQASGRCHRPPQDHPVLSRYFLARGTIDEEMHAIIERKHWIGGTVLGDEGSIARPLIEAMLRRTAP